MAVLRASDRFILDRVKNMPEAEQGAGSKGYGEAEIIKRLKEYRQANNAEDGSPSLADFFKERGVETLMVDLETRTREVVLKQIKVFAERNGKPKNYMTEDEEKEQVRLQAVKQEEERKKREEEAKKTEEEETQAQLREQKRAIDEKRTAKFFQEERQMLEMKAQPIR